MKQASLLMINNSQVGLLILCSMGSMSQSRSINFRSILRNLLRPRMGFPSWIEACELGIIGTHDWPVAVCSIIVSEVGTHVLPFTHYCQGEGILLCLQ